LDGLGDVVFTDGVVGVEVGQSAGHAENLVVGPRAEPQGVRGVFVELPHPASRRRLYCKYEKRPWFLHAEKERHEFVARLDVEVERLVSGRLRALYREDAVLGEESGLTLESSK